ncbi:MAG: enoyl-CoA hydratase/isomerase family protein [Dehalococcoidia bacterium]
MAYADLRFETDGPLATITLNRETRLNALGKTLVEELVDVVGRLERDPDVRVVILTGAGRAFCAGADIKERAENPDDFSLQRTSSLMSPTFRRFERLKQVVIAAMNGVAAGGGLELAMACDFRIASSEVKVAMPEVKLGILPGAGGTQRLPRLIGAPRAKRMMFFGDFIEAAQAEEWGILDKVVAPEALMDEARLWAERLLAMAPLSIASIKSAVNVGMDTDLDSGIEYEQRCSTIVAMSEDRREGYRAFVEKRPPQFQGR